MRRKIVLPFMLLFLVGFGALISVALWASARSVEERVLAEVHSLAGVLTGQPDQLLSQVQIDRVSRVLRAEAVLYGWEGRGEFYVQSSSSGAPEALRDPGPDLPYGRDFKRFEAGGATYVDVHAVFVHEGRKTWMLVVYRWDRIQGEKLAAMLPLMVSSVIGLLLVLVVGFWIARKLAHPLETLAIRTEALARGDFEHKVEIASRDELGRLAASFNSMLDSIRRLQDERVRAEKLAALGQVTAGIAHEIRNPLTAMKMTLQILLDAEPAGDRRESLSVILKETERLQLTVDGLLAYAKPPALSLAPGDLNDVARGALGVLDAQVKHVGVTLESRLGELPRVALDAPRMHQVVVNLLLNAVQAAGAGGRVTVSTEASSGEVRLSVTDSGPGIPVEARSRVFEPFYSTKTGGIGLGLAVSKRLVDDHGGRLSFDGTPGRTTFTVTLSAART